VQLTTHPTGYQDILTLLMSDVFLMLRTTLIVGICMMAILPLALAQSSRSASRAPWCTINPAQLTHGGEVEIAEKKIHIVPASKQPAAQKQLINATFVKVDRREASRLVRNPTELSDAGNFYLVRASAFDLDQQYTIVSRLEAYVLPEERALSIANTKPQSSGAYT
jgi:hypothetical protein